MEPVRQPKVNLSFSIENILRDDFPHRHHRANGCNLSQHESSFGRWSNTAAVYPYHAAHHSSVIVKSLPNGLQGQILFEEHNKMEDCSSCKHELKRLHTNDPIMNDREVKKSFISKTCSNGFGARKRKRRNRSHFTQHQLQYLERLFSRQKYLTRDERMVLARSLDMTELQIRNWFQNRRYLKRRQTNNNAKQDKPDSSTRARV